MQSNGGVIGLRQAAEQAARVVLSGPAGGVVGAFAVAKQALALSPEHPVAPDQINLITFDMGGTSTDVALCPGRIPTTAESTITDLPLRLPVIDIHTVGAGGGSIAFVDTGGALQVGPRSAGAVPGPVCYGRGGIEPTVTDANVVLGRLDPEGFLGGHGQVTLDVSAARRALSELGARLGLSAEDAALGVVRVANATMERALRTVSVERGHDPRDFILLPFGGAGPLHACDLAEALGMRRILCPPIPGVLSAYGMLVADVVSDASQSVLSSAGSLLEEPRPLQDAYAALAARVLAVMAQEQTDGVTLSASLDMRYRGQSYELTVPLPDDGEKGPEGAGVAPSAHILTSSSLAAAVDAFHAAHAQRYGYAMREETVEVVTLRVRGSAPGAQLALPQQPLAGEDAAAARLADRRVWFDAAGPLLTACYARSRLQPGNRFQGPAVVFQYDATAVIAPGWNVRVDEMGNLWMERMIQ